MAANAHEPDGSEMDRVRAVTWRIGLALGAVVLGAALMSACSNPARYRAPWCTNFGDGGVNECSYSTFEECRIAVSGVGGICTMNPSYSNGSAGARRPAQRSQ